MIELPTDEKKLLPVVNDLIQQCRVSVDVRASYCKLMNAISETGRSDGTKSLMNLLHLQLERTAAHLFSPVELKFTLDYELSYPKNRLEQAKTVGIALTRSWERNNTDLLFGQGVFESLKYGAALLKQWVQAEGRDLHPSYYAKIIMPWQFGVYNEAENDINKQPALCETTTMTMPEVWRRIYMLPDAKKLYNRISAHAMTGNSNADPTSFFHQVLSASQLQTGVQQSTRPLPGGIVQLNNDPNYAVMGPTVMAPTVKAHELWVQGETDYTTVIMIEPDIIIAPLYKHENLLIPGSKDKDGNIEGSMVQPYRLIQANVVSNWFWGRSELVDLIEPQGLLSMWLDDLKRLFGLQVDKILAFASENGMTDEMYAQFRAAGYFNTGPGGKVEDLTPKFPAEMLPLIKWLIETINWLGGFPDIMQGKGEPGVRAGVHASTLLKTASPTLRDRALLVERQCANAADLHLQIKEAKEDRKYWTDGSTVEKMAETEFMLTDLPDDWRVTVDSHSSSPIFNDDNAQLIMAGMKLGVVGPNYVLDNLPFPNRESARAEKKDMAEAQQQQLKMLMQHDPEGMMRVQERKLIAGSRR